jgi:hypothetical protein
MFSRALIENLFSGRLATIPFVVDKSKLDIRLLNVSLVAPEITLLDMHWVGIDSVIKQRYSRMTEAVPCLVCIFYALETLFNLLWRFSALINLLLGNLKCVSVSSCCDC